MFDLFQNLRDPEGGQHMLRRFRAMLSDGRHAFDLAVTAIVSGGDPAAVREEVFETDQRINKNEQALRRELIVHASVRGTTAFPTSLLLMSLVKDAERIGDYAKNILDLARHESVLSEEEQDLITPMAAKASDMLGRAARLFDSQDEASQRRLTANLLAQYLVHCSADSNVVLVETDPRTGKQIRHSSQMSTGIGN